MKRLTTMSEITGLPMLVCFKESCGEDSCSDECETHGNGSDCENCKIQEAVTKLFEYEKDEETGLRVVLPCAIGTEVYILHNTRGCNNCVNLNVKCDGVHCPAPTYYKKKLKYSDLERLEDIKLTFEEAEAALKGGENLEV